MKRIGIIGGGLAGLAAAALLARRGHQVVLFEGAKTFGGKAQTLVLDGCAFDTGPTLLTMPDTVRGVLEEAGAVAPAWRSLSTQCSYVFHAGAAFDAFASVEQTAASIERIAPEETRGLRTFYDAAERLYVAAGEPYLTAPFEGYVDYAKRSLRAFSPRLVTQLLSQSLAGMAAVHFRTERMQQFAGRFATYVGTSPYVASPALAMIAHVERAFGVHHVMGGMRQIVDALAAAATKPGAVLHTNVVARHRVDGRAFVIEPAGERFDAVVVNADPLAHKGTQRPLALSGHVLLLSVDQRLALPHHRVHFSRDYRGEFAELMRGEPPSEPTLYLCHAAATDPTAAPANKSGLYAMINMPAAAPFTSEVLAAVRERMIERLYACEPALRGHVTVVGERTPNDFHALGAPGGSIYGHLERGAFGPFKRPRMRGKPAGLFFAGGGTHPGGGVPMVLTSGRFAAAMAAAHVEA